MSHKSTWIFNKIFDILLIGIGALLKKKLISDYVNASCRSIPKQGQGVEKGSYQNTKSNLH